MPKTTKGDGMERRATRFFARENQEFKELYVPQLTKLLRRVAKEIKMNQSVGNCCLINTPMNCNIHDKVSASLESA